MEILNWLLNLGVPIAVLLIILAAIFWKVLIPLSNAHVNTVTKVGVTVEKMGTTIEKIGDIVGNSTNILKTISDDGDRSQKTIKEIVENQDEFRAYFEREFPRICQYKHKPPE